MKSILNISKAINILALSFLIFGPYGIAITGFLQVLAAIFYLIAFPKSKLIYIYFAVVGLFFSFWNEHVFDWQFTIPIGLLIYLTYIIHFKKIQL